MDLLISMNVVSYVITTSAVFYLQILSKGQQQQWQ